MVGRWLVPFFLKVDINLFREIIGHPFFINKRMIGKDKGDNRDNRTPIFYQQKNDRQG
jgi:hypothetical protein